MTEKTKCTTKDYLKFMEFCRQHLKDLRLTNWTIKYQFSKQPADMLARCAYNVGSWDAIITLFEDWSPDDVVTDKTLNEAAYHEVLHLVFAELMSHIPNEAYPVMCTIEHEAIKRLALAKFRKPK